MLFITFCSLKSFPDVDSNKTTIKGLRDTKYKSNLEVDLISYNKNEEINDKSISTNWVKLEELVTNKCNKQKTIKALADLVFGEANTLPDEQKMDVVRFVVSEAIRNNRSICEEKIAKAGSRPTSAYRYTSVYTVESKKQKWQNSYKRQVEWVESLFNKNIEVVKYDHFITVDLARTKPPRWFKYHIKEFNVTGAHVFVLLDFRDKQLEGYNKLMKEI